MKHKTNPLPRGDSAQKIILIRKAVSLWFTHFVKHFYFQTREFYLRNTITFLRIRKILIFGKGAANSKVRE